MKRYKLLTWMFHGNKNHRPGTVLAFSDEDAEMHLANRTIQLVPSQPQPQPAAAPEPAKPATPAPPTDTKPPSSDATNQDDEDEDGEEDEDETPPGATNTPAGATTDAPVKQSEPRGRASARPAR